jgi:hypothetical protein
VGLAIDDFGTGYSSLAYLRKHPIDRLKIDRSFVTDLPHNPDAAAIVNAIVQMGQSLHLEILAEGVESTEQLQLLQRDGLCHDARVSRVSAITCRAGFGMDVATLSTATKTIVHGLEYTDTLS